MLVPIKCLTYSLLINNNNFINWYNDNNKTFKDIDLKFKNDKLDFNIYYEHCNMFYNRDSLDIIPEENIKTSLFLNFGEDKYYERIEQKVIINSRHNFNKKKIIDRKSIGYLKKSNYFLTKNNIEIEYSEIEKELIKEIENFRF
jgi:hypothetical protein